VGGKYDYIATLHLSNLDSARVVVTDMAGNHINLAAIATHWADDDLNSKPPHTPEVQPLHQIL